MIPPPPQKKKQLIPNMKAPKIKPLNPKPKALLLGLLELARFRVSCFVFWVDGLDLVMAIATGVLLLLLISPHPKPL